MKWRRQYIYVGGLAAKLLIATIEVSLFPSFLTLGKGTVVLGSFGG